MSHAPNRAGSQCVGASAKKRPPVFLVAVVMAVLSAVACGQCAEAAGENRPNLSGKTAPDFALTDLSGKTVRLADFKGEIVLLDFWATWCGPCRREIPDLIQLQKQYADKGFTILGISLDEEGAAVVKPFAREFGINYPLVIASPQVTAAYGGIQAVPTAFPVDRDGRILQIFVGGQDKSDFEQAIRSALPQNGTVRGKDHERNQGGQK
jgi:peroxiredoxin